MQGLCCQISHILKYWDFGLQHINFGGDIFQPITIGLFQSWISLFLSVEGARQLDGRFCRWGILWGWYRALGGVQEPGIAPVASYRVPCTSCWASPQPFPLTLSDPRLLSCVAWSETEVDPLDCDPQGWGSWNLTLLWLSHVG